MSVRSLPSHARTDSRPDMQTALLTKPSLTAHHCFESVDRVGGEPDTTEFKRRARLHQALWREAHDLPIGSQPIRVREGQVSRPLGSRIDFEFALRTGANFLTPAARDAAAWRIDHPEKHQTLKVDRLYADLLSSMPMCFNLFGPAWADAAVARRLVAACWPDAPGAVQAVRFEWSPERPPTTPRSFGIGRRSRRVPSSRSSTPRPCLRPRPRRCGDVICGEVRRR
jgi:hypothetical protein